MNEWMAQWYAKFPAPVNVNEREPPALITLVSQTPVSEVEVWLNVSRFVHVTVSPTRTGVVGGLNDEFWMVTALVAPSATSGSASNPHEIARAAGHATAAPLTAILYGPCRPASPLTARSRRSHAMPSVSAFVWTPRH
jgi:hypothetical protein